MLFRSVLENCSRGSISEGNVAKTSPEWVGIYPPLMLSWPGFNLEHSLSNAIRNCPLFVMKNCPTIGRLMVASAGDGTEGGGADRTAVTGGRRFDELLARSR